MAAGQVVEHPVQVEPGGAARRRVGAVHRGHAGPIGENVVTHGHSVGTGACGILKRPMVGVMSVGPPKRSAAPFAVAAAAALLLAAPAAADPADDAFLSALADNGIVINDPDTAISMAHTVCAGFDSKQPASLLAMKAMRNTNLTAKQAGFFVGLSVSAYCPQYKGQTGGTLNWLHMPPPNM
ncbi:DUF732 domain-containing protein [Mycobacterium scrofulaceum]